MPIIKDDPAFSEDLSSYKMKIQESENLKRLATQANKQPEQLSLEIYEHLNMWLMLDGQLNYWGHTIAECIEDETNIPLLLCGLCIAPTPTNIEMFLSLVIILGGDCPVCGSDLEVDPDKSEYKQSFGDGYVNPIEHEPTLEVLVCPHCKYSEIK